MRWILIKPSVGFKLSLDFAINFIFLSILHPLFFAEKNNKTYQSIATLISRTSYRKYQRVFIRKILAKTHNDDVATFHLIVFLDSGKIALLIVRFLQFKQLFESDLLWDIFYEFSIQFFFYSIIFGRCSKYILMCLMFSSNNLFHKWVFHIFATTSVIITIFVRVIK